MAPTRAALGDREGDQAGGIIKDTFGCDLAAQFDI